MSVQSGLKRLKIVRREEARREFRFLEVIRINVFRYTYQDQIKLFDRRERNFLSRLESVLDEIFRDLSKNFYHEKHDR